MSNNTRIHIQSKPIRDLKAKIRRKMNIKLRNRPAKSSKHSFAQVQYDDRLFPCIKDLDEMARAEFMAPNREFTFTTDQTGDKYNRTLNDVEFAFANWTTKERERERERESEIKLRWRVNSRLHAIHKVTIIDNHVSSTSIIRRGGEKKRGHWIIYGRFGQSNMRSEHTSSSEKWKKSFSFEYWMHTKDLRIAVNIKTKRV